MRGEGRVGNPTSDETRRVHFNCDFHPCALAGAEVEEEARIPLLVCRQWCGLCQFIYRSACCPRSLYFSRQIVQRKKKEKKRKDRNNEIKKERNRAGISVLQENPTPLLAGHTISSVYARALSSPPTFQLVELELGLVQSGASPTATDIL